MSSTIFIALQCCQCSTMQVKQKKKSSNKWSCVVCNQKQSVQKVFAQGFMAKDLRKFVQDFNMSRKFIDEGQWLLDGNLNPASSEQHDGEPELRVNQMRKRRTDWTAYLDQDNHNHIIKGAENEQDGDDDLEPVVVTELNKGMMLKKPRSEENSGGFGGGRSAKLSKKPPFPNSQEEPRTYQRRAPLSEGNSERNSYITQDNRRRTQNCKPASKWNDYVTDDSDNVELGWKRGINFENDDTVLCKNTFLEAISNVQKVEDDIHPDFM